MSPTDTPVVLATGVCATGVTPVSETNTMGDLVSEATGVAGTGLEPTAAPIDVVEFGKLSAAGGCSPEEPLTVGGAELAFVSGRDVSAAAFSACSRANWKHKSEN